MLTYVQVRLYERRSNFDAYQIDRQTDEEHPGPCSTTG